MDAYVEQLAAELADLRAGLDPAAVDLADELLGTVAMAFVVAQLDRAADDQGDAAEELRPGR
ncbi:hypothetical protein [Kitasatospora sp. SC0581]|uniref:hypothetical protein n=1 Tax=Kitasatospora sp. SC0581 TaxID=3394360 RepID=UPI003A895457